MDSVGGDRGNNETVMRIVETVVVGRILKTMVETMGQWNNSGNGGDGRQWCVKQWKCGGNGKTAEDT
eukprot:6554261-Pyramimonas_sp.AAC.1